MDIIKAIASELNVRNNQVEAAVKLIDEGCTIPFISRYRKEATGALNDEQLRNLDERLKYLRNLEDKKTQVIASIAEQGLLTDELKNQIEKADTMVAVEDLYRPYRPKRRTRATIAKEKGLEPLANIIMLQMTGEPVVKTAEEYVSEEKDVKTPEDAVAGAKDIIAESISDNADYRTRIRELTFKEGVLTSAAKDAEAKTVYEMYYNFSEPAAKMAGHRILAVNRGENEKILTVKIEAPVDKILAYLEKQIIVRDNQYTTGIIKEAIEDSYERLIAPSIEREIRNQLTETAEAGAIKVFGKNLEQLLLQPPITGHVVLGWDPAFRTGCKLAVVSPTSSVLNISVIYPHEPHNKWEESKKTLKDLFKKYNIDIVAIGNGTASRESEKLVAETISEYRDKEIKYIIVSEAGASVYSASDLAIKEFPDLTVEKRSAISIARRLQDPLSELVKIDSKSIGVGQYQHDVNEKKLDESLDFVVSKCVNNVGVNVNTASRSILKYISGLTKSNIDKIIEYREENGKVLSRDELMKKKVLTPKAYEQSIGFMRIIDGTNPMDVTSIHPESYGTASKLLDMYGFGINDLGSKKLNDVLGAINIKEVSEKLGTDIYTLEDIIKCFSKPNRDFRDDFDKPLLKSDILKIEDLKVGMELYGTVRNVVDFGAFIDIGLHDDGLVHISKMTDKYIKHPSEVVSVGDIVTCYVDDISLKKNRVSLSLINPNLIKN